jgi:hypothetical protein
MRRAIDAETNTVRIEEDRKSAELTLNIFYSGDVEQEEYEKERKARASKNWFDYNNSIEIEKDNREIHDLQIFTLIGPQVNQKLSAYFLLNQTFKRFLLLGSDCQGCPCSLIKNTINAFSSLGRALQVNTSPNFLSDASSQFPADWCLVVDGERIYAHGVGTEVTLAAHQNDWQPLAVVANFIDPFGANIVE